MTRQEFGQMLDTGEILLDGAMGSNLYKAGMPHGCCVEAWLLDHRDAALKLQKKYVEAGSQIIYAPTFGANRVRLEKYGLADQITAMNHELAALSREAAGECARVAGDLAPTGMMLTEFGGNNTPEELFEVYRQQAGILAEAGCDLFAIETMMSVAEAEIAVDAVRSVCAYPVICTLSVRRDGSAYYGGNLIEGARTMKKMKVDAYGLNCGWGLDGLAELIALLYAETDIPIVAKPNAGLPHLKKNGRYGYDYSPDMFADKMRDVIKAGAKIVGGCCGTDPAFISELNKLIRGEKKDD